MAAVKKAESKASVFSKEQIRGAKKYEKDIDIVSALLKDGKTYSLAEVDKIIDDYKKGKVK